MFATFYLPDFYLQAALRHHILPPATPAGLIEEKEKKPVIVQLNDAAKAVGIHPGMTPSQALARSLKLIVKVRSPVQEKAMQDILLHHAFSLSPYVEATGAGLCTVEWKNDHSTRRIPVKQKVSRVIDCLAAAEIFAQAGISRTPDSSFLAAHLARPILEIEDPAAFLDPLPIDILTIAVR